MRRRARTDLCGGRSVRIVPTATDTVVTADTTAADPTGNPNFNAQNLQASSGEFWGVMALTPLPDGHVWDYESALKDPAQTSAPASYSDKGVSASHGSADRW